MKKEKRFISIKTKLLGFILPAIMIIVTVLTCLSYFVSKNVIKTNAQESLKTSVGSQCSEIEAWLEKNLKSFHTAKRTLEQMDFDEKQLQNFLDAYYDFDSNYPEGLRIADAKGKLYSARGAKAIVLRQPDAKGNYVNNVKMAGGAGSGSDEKTETDVTQSEWFKDGLTRVNMGFTNAHANENGEQVISACGMLKSKKDSVRVLAADLSLDKISAYVNGFVRMKEAESFLVNAEDLTILAAYDTNLISKTLNETNTPFMQAVGKSISENDLGMKEISGNISVFENVQGTDWVLVSYVPSKVVYHDLYWIRNIMILFGVVSLVILTVLFERIIHLVIRPVKKLTDVIRTITDGDFTIHVDARNNDEIGIMSRCVEQFIETMRNMIASVNGVSHILHEQADSGKDVSDQMFSASKRQNQSMRELNETVEQLSISINGIAESASTLAVLVTETKNDGSNVNDKMTETVDVSRKGKAAMKDVGVAMQEINESVRKLQTTIDKVESTSEEITSITEVIGNIADETSLLSLNASIEAARAGESGKGFAVVAMEIGKLAQTSMDSVQHINELILDIKSSIGDVISQAVDSVSNINASNVLIENASETFDIIFENIRVVGDLVQEMIEKVDQVEEEARNVAAISQEQAASSEEIAASSDILVEQANGLMANSETVKNESSELTDSAQELASQIGKFRIEHENIK